MKIPLSLSRILGSIAESAAADEGLAMAIAIVDREGSLQYFARMEGTLPASTELAVSKAYTAAALRMSTREVGEMALPGRSLYGIQHTHGGKIVLFGGGFPLLVRGLVAGGIGISGGTVEEDERVAGVVLNALGEMESLIEWIKPLCPARPGGACRTTFLEENLRDAFRREARSPTPEFLSILAGAIILGMAEVD